MNFFEWLSALARDANPIKDGFQPSWFYVFWNVVFPAAFGVTVAFIVNLIKSLFTKTPKESG
ncbi:hypothetical protein ACFL01_02990 [Planctomycetota bacterium]